MSLPKGSPIVLPKDKSQEEASAASRAQPFRPSLRSLITQAVKHDVDD